LYRKITADVLFDGLDYRPPGSVLVMGGSDSIVDVIARDEAGEDIQHLPGLLMPGHINAHCHLELSHLEGVIPPGTGLVDFLTGVMEQRESTEEKILDAIAAAEQSMLDAGIVAVGDICNTSITEAQKRRNKLIYHHFVELSGVAPKLADLRWSRARAVEESMQTCGGRTSLVPHAPYSVSEKLLSMLGASTETEVFTIHCQESEAEMDFFSSRKGPFVSFYDRWNISTDQFPKTINNSLAYVLPHLPYDRNLILVHNVVSKQQDIALAQQHFSQHPELLFHALCPSANQYISGCLPDVRMMHEMGCRFVLGTDSLASNTRLSIWQEVKCLAEKFTDLPVKTWLRAATHEGARALKLENQLGLFRKGMRPGLFHAELEGDFLERIKAEVLH
jgi:cytosine/adenosine deaminase-related metal-dependent hydrolase